MSAANAAVGSGLAASARPVDAPASSTSDEDVIDSAKVSELLFQPTSAPAAAFDKPEGVIDFEPLIGNEVWKARFAPGADALDVGGRSLKYAILELSEKAHQCLSSTFHLLDKNIFLSATPRFGVPPGSALWGPHFRVFIVGTDDLFVLNRLWLLTGHLMGAGLMSPPALVKPIHKNRIISVLDPVSMVKGSEGLYVEPEGVSLAGVVPGSRVVVDKQSVTIPLQEVSGPRYVSLGIDDELYTRHEAAVQHSIRESRAACTICTESGRLEGTRLVVVGPEYDVVRFLADLWFDLELPVNVAQFLRSVVCWFDGQKLDMDVLLIQLQRLVERETERRVAVKCAELLARTAAAPVVVPAPAPASRVSASVASSSPAPLPAPVEVEAPSKKSKAASTPSPPASAAPTPARAAPSNPPLAATPAAKTPAKTAPTPLWVSGAQAPNSASAAPAILGLNDFKNMFKAPSDTYHIQTHALRLDSEVKFGATGMMKVDASMEAAMKSARFFRLSPFFGKALQANGGEGYKLVKDACKVSIMNENTVADDKSLGYCMLIKGDEEKRIAAQSAMREFLRRCLNKPPSASDAELGIDWGPPFFISS